MPKGDGKSFTDAVVRNAKEGEHFDAKTPGLGIRVSPKGKRTWFFRYRTPGRGQRRQKLGVYPFMDLKEARKRARVRLGEVSGGSDRWSTPALTFREAAEEALALMAQRTRPRTIRERQRIFERDLIPKWGDRLVTDIRRGDVAALVDEIAARGSPVMANRTLSLVRALFNAALDLERVESNPATRPDRFFKEERPRERALSQPELKAILKAVKEEGPEGRAFFGLVAFTVQRAGAVAAAEWEEFDLELRIWTIPPVEGRKFKKYARKVPLNDGAMGALGILQEEKDVEGPYLFPSRKGSKEPHFTNWGNLQRRLRGRSGVDGWTLHDLRATCRTTVVRRFKVPAEVADAVLGHAITTVGHVHYEADKSTYLLDEKRKALVKWGQHLEGLSGSTGVLVSR